MKVSVINNLVAVALLSIATTAAPYGSSSVELEPRGLRTLGKSCTLSLQCVSSAYCENRRCAAKRTAGQSCTKSISCAGSSLCHRNKCAPGTGRSLGTPCLLSSQCSSNYCGLLSCRAKAAINGACYNNDGCASGLCKRAKCVAKTPTTPTPAPEPGTEPPRLNPPLPVATPITANQESLGSFSTGTLGQWLSTGSVRVVSNGNGGFVVRIGATGSAPASITRTVTAFRRGLAEDTDGSLAKRQAFAPDTVRVDYSYFVQTYTIAPQPDGSVGRCWITRLLNTISTGDEQIPASALTATTFTSGFASYMDPPGGPLENVQIGAACTPGSSITVDFGPGITAERIRGAPLVPPPPVADEPALQNAQMLREPGFESSRVWNRGNDASLIQSSQARSGSAVGQLKSLYSDRSESELNQSVMAPDDSPYFRYQAWVWYKVTEFKANKTTDLPEQAKVCAVAIRVAGRGQEQGVTEAVRFTSTGYDRYELLFFDKITLEPGVSPNKLSIEVSCGPGVASAAVFVDDARMQVIGSTEPPPDVAEEPALQNTQLLLEPGFESDEPWSGFENARAVQDSEARTGSHIGYLEAPNGNVARAELIQTISVPAVKPGVLRFQAWFWYKVSAFRLTDTPGVPESEQTCTIGLSLDAGQVSEYKSVSFTSRGYDRYELFSDVFEFSAGVKPDTMRIRLECGSEVARVIVRVDDARLQIDGDAALAPLPQAPAEENTQLLEQGGFEGSNGEWNLLGNAQLLPSSDAAGGAKVAVLEATSSNSAEVVQLMNQIRPDELYYPSGGLTYAAWAYYKVVALDIDTAAAAGDQQCTLTVFLEDNPAVEQASKSVSITAESSAYELISATDMRLGGEGVPNRLRFALSCSGGVRSARVQLDEARLQIQGDNGRPTADPATFDNTYPSVIVNQGFQGPEGWTYAGDAVYDEVDIPGVTFKRGGSISQVLSLVPGANYRVSVGWRLSEPTTCKFVFRHWTRELFSFVPFVTTGAGSQDPFTNDNFNLDPSTVSLTLECDDASDETSIKVYTVQMIRTS